MVGPAGTGKTLPIVTFLHCLADDVPGLRILLLRATRKSLTESVLRTYEEEVLPADGAESVAAGATRGHRAIYQYPNGSSIVCGGLDRNATSVLSTAWDVVFANEAIELRQDVWETLASRMMRPGRDRRFGWLIGDTNPASPDHWLKARCEAGKAEMWETTHRSNPRMFDGRRWTREGRDYLAQLGHLTGVRRKRYLHGAWAAGDEAWFDTFDPDVHVAPAEFDPSAAIHVSVDSGVHTGAVIFQLVGDRLVVLADYFAENRAASSVASDLDELSTAVAPGCRLRVVSTDSAGDSRQANGGPIITGEYVRAGLCNADGDVLRWPKYPGCIADGLALVETYVGGTEHLPPRMTVHPRAKGVRAAFENYQRAKVNGVLMDYPADPQHPHEEYVDCLRGALSLLHPEGRRPAPKLTRRPASNVF